MTSVANTVKAIGILRGAAFDEGQANAIVEAWQCLGEDLATKRDVEQLRETMEAGFQQVDQRFQQVDQRFQQIDQRFQQVEQRFARTDQRIDDRFEQMKTEMRASGNDLLLKGLAGVALIFGLVTGAFRLLGI